MGTDYKAYIEKNRINILKTALKLEYDSGQLWFTDIVPNMSKNGRVNLHIEFLHTNTNYSPGVKQKLYFLATAMDTLGADVRHSDRAEYYKAIKKVLLSKSSQNLVGTLLFNMYKGHYPGINKEKAIKEFLLRGFIHFDNALGFSKDKYALICTMAPLVWPKQFEHQQDGLIKAVKVGIRGYTQCTDASWQKRYYLK